MKELRNIMAELGAFEDPFWTEIYRKLGSSPEGGSLWEEAYNSLLAECVLPEEDPIRRGLLFPS